MSEDVKARLLHLLGAQNVALNANGGYQNSCVNVAAILSRGGQKPLGTLRVVMFRGFRYDSKKV